MLPQKTSTWRWIRSASWPRACFRQGRATLPPAPGLVHRAIERQATDTPKAIALTCGAESLTYFDLNARANQLAHRLRALGVGPEVLVGIYLDRSPEMVVGLLAILKAGGAYVPLDPAYPIERLAFMLDDSRASIILTEERLQRTLHGSLAPTLRIDTASESIEEESARNLVGGAEAANLAYMIYTSGSTGRPKGVQITHGALANLLHSMRKTLSIREHDALLAVTTLSFDIAALEIFLPLMVGARVELIGRDAADGWSPSCRAPRRSSHHFSSGDARHVAIAARRGLAR